MARDPSVVSRRLKILAETFPVLKKNSGKWGLTNLGKEVADEATQFIGRLQQLLAEKKDPSVHLVPESAALLVINAQAALLNPSSGLDLDIPVRNIARLISRWRKTGGPLVFMRHVSQNPKSPFYQGGAGVGFIDKAAPDHGEVVVDKQHSSAFKDTELLGFLETAGVNHLYLAGFTGNECIDATARDGCEYGFGITVIEDASASVGVFARTGEFYEAHRVHSLMLANIAALYGQVIQTADLF